MKVLILDDQQTVSHIIEGFLNRYAKGRELGVDIVVSSDPAAALFELMRHGSEYDALIMDVRMPHLTGDSIYEALSRLQPQLVEHLLFITAHREDLELRFPDTPLHILEKPFRYEAFKEAVAAIIG